MPTPKIATTDTGEKTAPIREARHVAPWVYWLVPVLLASVLLRAVIVATSAVQTTPDSPGYVALADNLLHRNLADDPGERTPVYPLFLALCGLQLPLVRLAQMALGVGIAAALFWLAWQVTRSGRIAALVAACYGLGITAVLHEDAILTETLATALIVALACLVYLVEQALAYYRSVSGESVRRGGHAGGTTALPPRIGARANLETHDAPGRAVREPPLQMDGEAPQPSLTGTYWAVICCGPSQAKAYATKTCALGAVAGLIALTRPLYAFVPVVLVLPFVMRRRSSIARGMIARGICFSLLPALLIVGGWSAYNAARFGTFAPTVLTGYNLSNHSGGFIEDAPERDALRDVYLKYRAGTIAETGSHVTTIWAARPEMLARTGLTNAQLSQALASLSLRLFVHHPARYAASVAGSWLRFWNSPGEWRWQGTDNAAVGSVVGALWMMQRCGLIVVNILFLALTMGAACSRRLRAWWRPSPLLATLCALIWATSVVQALLESGSNTRFGVPTQPLVAFVVIVSAASFARPVSRG